MGEGLARGVAGAGFESPVEVIVRGEAVDELSGEGLGLGGGADAGGSGVTGDEQAKGMALAGEAGAGAGRLGEFGDAAADGPALSDEDGSEGDGGDEVFHYGSDRV